MNAASFPGVSHETDSDIQLIRALAAALIVVCHIFEIYGSPAAWWANFGVQVFLVLSGCLFGARTIRDWPQWFGRRARRILPAYWLLITIVFAVNCFVMKPAVLWKPYLATLAGIQDFCKITLPGCDHLWYITLLLVCYAAVPALQAVRDRWRGEAASAAVFFIGLPIAFYLIYKLFFFLTFAYVANVAAFAWGYWLGARRAGLMSSGRYRRALPWALAAAGLLVAARGALEALAPAHPAAVGAILGKLVPVSKIGLAALLFLPLYGRRLAVGSSRLVGLVADNSYEIYLTHHIFIFGTLSVMALFRSRTLAIAVMLTATAAATALLRRAAQALAGAFKQRAGAPMAAPAIRPAPAGDGA